MPDYGDVNSFGMTPEELQQLVSLGALGDEGDILNQQLQQAIALRNKKQPEHSTGIGGGLGALAQIGDSITSNVKEAQLRQQQQDLLKQQTQARLQYANILGNQQQAQPGQMSQGQQQYDIPQYLKQPEGNQGQFVPFSFGG